MTEYRSIRPVDVLFLRGNRLFGGAGEHGAATMPPWPSVFAGAVASLALAEAGRIGEATARPSEAARILQGLVGDDFGITFLGITLEDRVYLPLPADLVVAGRNGGGHSIRALAPRPAGGPLAGLATSSPTPSLPVLVEPKREKAETGLWMSLDGWRSHLAGELPGVETLVPQTVLWAREFRLGIALNRDARTAAEGALYTSETVALPPLGAFACGFSGTGVPRDGLLRLGGDGRGARIEVREDPVGDTGEAEPGWPGFRLLLTTPGIFPGGWMPPGLVEDGGATVLRTGGLEAELVAAGMPRYEVISGWDLAQHAPKPARKAVPAGSVYWFRVREGDTAALASLRNTGLYGLLGDDGSAGWNEEWAARRREGYGRVWLGAWDPN